MPRGQIIILGMHRSGTSCVGNLLTKMGVYFGNEAISTGAGEENRKGFFERRDVRDICDAILQGSGCDWWAANDFSPERVPAPIRKEATARFTKVLEEMQSHQPWFIKEPRLCLVWPLLSAQVANPVFIHVWRHPLEVARSLAERNGFPIDFGTALWETYVRSAHSVSRGRPSFILSYNKLLKDPAGVTRHLVEKLGGLGVTDLALPQKPELDDAVDAELYRQRQVSPELEELIMPSQHQLIAALADGDPTNPVLFQPLSPASRLRVQDWTRREGAILALRTGALEAKRLKADLADLQAEQSRVKATDSDLAKVKTEIAERDELLKVERNLVTALNTELSELKTSLDKQDEQLEAEQSRIAALNSELTELKKESEKRDKRFKAEQNRRMALNNELAEKNSAIANLNSDIRRSTIILQHERMSAQKAFFGGIRATLSATQSAARARSALYLHYLIVRRRKDADNLALLAASGFFDPAYYLERNADAAEAGTDPLIHFIDLGAAQGRNPSSFFDTAYYLEHNADVAASRINPLLHFVSRGRSEGRSPKAPKRIVIYTAVTAGYDELKPPGFRPSNCDFVAFSDQPLKVDGWEVRPLNYLHQDPTRAARFVKLHPHIYFPDYDYSIWMDGNISIRRDARDIGMRGDIRTFLLSLGENDFLGIFIHPLRDCIYVEAEECIKRSKDDEEVISRHVERYRVDGFPEKAGLWETNVLVRRHNDPSCIALMTAWWRELETGSRRDQLSLPVVAQRLSAKIAPLAQPGENARTHPLLNLTQHPSRRIAPVQATVPPVVRKDIDIDRISVDIGVCVHNSPNEVAACLTSLIAARRPQDSIFIVDDASDAPTATLLDQFATKYDRIKLIRHEQNEGYTRSANDVLKNTQSDWVVLLNSDTVVPSRALRKLITCGEQFSRIGIVGPLSNAASWQTVPQMTGPDKKFLVNQIPSTLTVEDMDVLCEKLSTGVVLFAPLVNGFCYAIRRALIRRIGYFDEAHFPTGYGEEDDYCLRAGAAGYICGIATDTYVYHVKSASFTSERRALLAAAGGKALRRKHSADRVAAAADMMRHHPELRRIRERIARRLETVTKQELIS